MSNPVYYEKKKKPSRAKKPAAYTITRLQYVEVQPERNPNLFFAMSGHVSVHDAKRLRNWLTSYLRWERKVRGV